jgi:hypothetical protein
VRVASSERDGGTVSSSETAFDRLETGFAVLAGDSDLEAPARAERLADVEVALLGFLDEERRRDPAFGGGRGHPVLAEAAAWRRRAEAQGLDAAADDAETLVGALIQDEAATWSDVLEAATDGGGAHACFERLMEAALLDRAALTRQRHPSLPASVGAERQRLRRTFLGCVSAEEPGAATRHRWGIQLVDAADVVLTSLDDLEPARAAMHLEAVIDDLSWYLHHVATLPSTQRRLRRKLRRLTVERQERELQASLAARFGSVRAARFDKLVVGLIFFVLGALVVEMIFDLPLRAQLALLVLDALACEIFLLDFFVRLALVRGKASWFLRHFLIDFLPSIPFVLLGIRFGLMGVHDIKADASRLGRGFRLARFLRFTRFARSFGFLARGFDRIARRYGHLLNHNIVLYPNRDERRQAERERASMTTRSWRLRARVGEEWRKLLLMAPAPERDSVARARIAGLERARQAGHATRPPRAGAPVASVRDIPAEAMLLRMQAVTAQEIETDLGQDFVARCARATRTFSRIPFRWMPVLRRYVPRVAPHMSDAAVTAAAAHSISAELKRHHDRWFWVADLHGTVTPSEFVDRVGSAMVRSSFRPAYRLLLFGAIYVVVGTVCDVMGFSLPELVKNLVGDTLLLLGGVCFVILGVGWWMKRLAGQATFFYERTAHAQFLSLTEAIKGRFLDRDAAILDRRVFAPEAALAGRRTAGGDHARRAAFTAAVRSWLIRARAGAEMGGLSEEMQRAILLYRDGLDGALLCDSDVRTTSQLIGNPALRELRGLSSRVDPKEAKALRSLDLTSPRSAIRGPYLWFSFITKAITQATARLIVEYNRHAIPQDELPYASLPERRRYQAWLRRGEPAPEEQDAVAPDDREPGYITTAFTALHFLDDDPARDREVAERFGDDVLRNMQHDRQGLFREIFGSYPLHTRPKERRVLNLYRLYQRWFGGGRAFVIPLRLLWRWVDLAGRFVRWLVSAIGEIRTPRRRHVRGEAPAADFNTALRKIGRMRMPIVWATLWLRARFDPEYLGVRIPGTDDAAPVGADWQADLAFIVAEPAEVRRVEAEQARAEADVRRLARQVDDGLLDAVAEHIGVTADDLGPEHVRAATAAYRADYRQIRALLSCRDLLEETTAAALHEAPARRPLWWHPVLRRAFNRWWRAHGRADREVRRALWRAVVHDRGGVRAALLAWHRLGATTAHDLGTRRLAEFLRHPGRISEQLVTLRTVQTLALIDLLNYREHVYRLGQYAALGDEAPSE